MRFSTTSALLALPLLGAAAEDGGLFGQYRAQFQNLLGSLGVGAPDVPAAGEAAPAGGAAAAAAAADADPAKPVRLTLGNWKQTLYSVVQPGATEPEEWRIMATGGNKTCFGMLCLFFLFCLFLFFCALAPAPPC